MKLRTLLLTFFLILGVALALLCLPMPTLR